jgi:hypothetical protein
LQYAASSHDVLLPLQFTRGTSRGSQGAARVISQLSGTHRNPSAPAGLRTGWRRR